MNPGIIDLDIDEVKEGLASGEITLVDVREPQEYAGGHIPGSALAPVVDVRSRGSFAASRAGSCSPAPPACARSGRSSSPRRRGLP